jgi:hypothetical protein
LGYLCFVKAAGITGVAEAFAAGLLHLTLNARLIFCTACRRRSASKKPLLSPMPHDVSDLASNLARDSKR